MKINFKEKQKFSQWWLWSILFGIALIPLYGIYKQIIKDEIFGNNPMSNMGLIIFAIGVFGLINFFWYMTLSTEVDNIGIKIHFKPFVKRTIKWNEIESVEMVNYGFVGYGIRFGSKYGTIYNTSGNRGLAIELINGKSFLIGTQRADELHRIVWDAKP